MIVSAVTHCLNDCPVGDATIAGDAEEVEVTIQIVPDPAHLPKHVLQSTVYTVIIGCLYSIVAWLHNLLSLVRESEQKQNAQHDLILFKCTEDLPHHVLVLPASG